MKKVLLALSFVLLLPAMALAQASLTLNWTDRSNNESGFRVYRDGVLLVTLASDASGTLAVGRTVVYTDAGLAYSTRFCYEGSAFNSAGESARTPSVCATTTNAPVTIPVGPDGFFIQVNPAPGVILQP